MDFSIVSLVNTLCFSSLAILLFVCIARKTGIQSMKRPFTLLIVFTIIIRLIVPAEFISQNNIYVTRIYPDLYLPFIKTTVSLAGKNIPLPLLAAGLSGIGSIAYFSHLLVSYAATAFMLRKCQPVNNESIHNIVTRICRELECKNHFHVVSDSGQTSPFLFGLIRPTIVLPDTKLPDEEWYYILKHEISHAYHKDLWMRFACELLLGIYWWNPFLYFLRKQVIELQEFYADKSVMKGLDELHQTNYMHCLVTMAKFALPTQVNKRIATFNDGTKLSGRIENFMHFSNKAPMKKKQSFVAVILSVLLLFCALLGPNFFILEPRGELPKEIQENYVRINSDNGYLLLREDGKFDIYVDNEYFATVTKIFDDTLPIFNTKGEQIK